MQFVFAPRITSLNPSPRPPWIETASIVLIAITFFAAIVNGALGYGFSSLTVPVALLFYTNRV